MPGLEPRRSTWNGDDLSPRNPGLRRPGAMPRNAAQLPAGDHRRALTHLGCAAAPTTAVAMTIVRSDARSASHGAANEPRIPPTPTNAKVAPINAAEAPRSRSMTITTRYRALSVKLRVVETSDVVRTNV